MLRFRGSVTALLFAVSALLGACSDDVFTRADAERRLREAGVANREAECIVDEVIARFDLDVLNEERDPTASERTALDEIRTECAAPS
ncbi:MAG TPA: hypothetical protein VFZ83_11845 [Acidimicrobiia bacterium]|nr:hypothetical protein [Acidimicrobiia bacterium]